LPLDFQPVNADEEFIKLIEKIRDEGLHVSLITGYCIHDALIAGTFFKMMNIMDIHSHIFHEYQDAPIEPGVSIIIGYQPIDCQGCFVLMRGNKFTAFRKGTNFILRHPVPQSKTLELVEENMIVTKEIKYLAAVSLLSEHIPRALRSSLDDEEEKFLNSMKDENLLDIKDGPLVIGAETRDPSTALKYSVDIMFPKYFMKDVPENVDLSLKFLIEAIGIKGWKIKGKNYIIKQDWFLKDLYEGIYSMITAADYLGINYVVASVLIPKYIPWFLKLHLSKLKVLADIVDKLTNDRYEKYGRYIIVRSKELPPLSAATYAAIGSGLIPEDSIMVADHGGNFHVPLQPLKHREASGLLRQGKIEGGMVVLKSVDVLKEGTK
jgi:hypothetical protein